MLKFVSPLLGVVILALVLLVVRANHKGQQLKTEYDRLAERYGAFELGDETQFHVVSTPTENPKRHFRWRLYHPNLPNGIGSQKRVWGKFHRSSVGSASAGETLAFANFRIRKETPELYVSFRGGSTVLQFPEKIRNFVAQHWDRLDFKILGENGTSVIPVTESLPLLVVKIPESLRDELPASTPIFELIVGDTKVLNNTP